jgi:sirohydrochlorin ferrochelatase
MTLAVLLAHGSPDPRSGELVRRTADLLSGRLGSPVVAAFLDHEGPDLAAAVTGTADEVAVLPLLLSSAYHARVDVPDAVARLDRQVARLAPLGHPDSVLDALLLRAGGRVVVVAAGTKVDEERVAFAASVVAASLRTGVPATSAFATGPGPRLDDVGEVDVVVPWLLAPGRLMDVVHVSADALGRRVDGNGLLLEPTMLDVLTILLKHRPSDRAT